MATMNSMPKEYQWHMNWHESYGVSVPDICSYCRKAIDTSEHTCRKNDESST